MDKGNDNKEEGQDHQHSGYPTLFSKVGASYPEFWEDDALKNNRKKNVNKSSLSQYVMCFPNAAGIHGALYGTWWCEPRNETLKAPAILRHLKPENS